MHELIPICGGILLGGLLSTVRMRAPWRILLTLAVAAGATLGSGEFHTSWSFLLLDLGEVAAASATVVLFQKYRRHRAPGQ